MKRLLIFLRSVLIPLTCAFLLAFFFRPVYTTDGRIDYFLAWVLIGFPFGMRQMIIWFIPKGYSLSGTLGITALSIIVGGLIGGCSLIYQLAKGIVGTING